METTKSPAFATVYLFAMCLVVGCSSSVPDAVRCSRNWKAQGYDFDPNSMDCSQMFERVQAIRRAKYWQEKGYYFDPNSMTTDQMNLKAKHINRARYWKETKDYDFDPNTMTIREMDRQAEELDKTEYWKKAGHYYDPNSQTVFLTPQKRTELK